MVKLLGQKVKNLSDLKILNDSTAESLENYSISLDHVNNVEIIFRKHKERLLSLIPEFDWVAGCVAWLTDLDILQALAKCSNVSLVVQKEDFLRPDIGGGSSWKQRLRGAYGDIKDSWRLEWPGLKSSLSVCAGGEGGAIRCMGNYNRDRVSAFPRMHNKFLVFGRSGELNDGGYREPIFTTAWTGSFNLTYNATMSFENVVLMRSPQAAEAFYKEYSQIYALSEPLDWEQDWCAPEFRIGT